MNKPAFQFIDLFAGIGGFHHALEAEGGQCVLAVERDADCQKVYRELFPDTEIVDDIRSITFIDEESDEERHRSGPKVDGHQSVDELVPDHDVLCAGFPCQPFSKSGYQEGTRDQTRGTLFYDIMTIVLVKKPQFVILENVRNLTGPRHTHTWKTIIDSLTDAGYVVSSKPNVLSPHLFSPEDGGAPQVRDRVFILAYRRNKTGNTPLQLRPTPGFDPDSWRIEDFLDDDAQIPNLTDYKPSKDEMAWLRAWQAFAKGIKTDYGRRKLPGFPIWVDEFQVTPNIPSGTPKWKQNFLEKNSKFYVENREFIDEWLTRTWGQAGTVKDFPPSRRKFEWQARKTQPFRKDRNLFNLVIQLRPSGIRVKPASYLPALVAITQTSIIGSRKRRITPKEGARLQGMPADTFAKAIKRVGIRDAAAYKQLGNAVNVGVAQFTAKALFKAGQAPWLR